MNEQRRDKFPRITMKRFQPQITSLAYLLIAGWSGCASRPNSDAGRSPLFGTQEELNTKPAFHEINTGFEGYIVTIEKTKNGEGRISREFGRDYAGVKAPGGGRAFNEEALSRSFSGVNSKVHFVSQIVRFDAAPSHKKSPDPTPLIPVEAHSAYDRTWSRTFLYDVYQRRPDEPMPFGAKDTTIPSQTRPARVAQLLDDGATAVVDTLKTNIHCRLAEGISEGKPYTHLVLVSTGWNTQSWESGINYTDWYDALRRAAAASLLRERFRPLFIGLTWTSDWTNANLGRFLPPPASFANKASDADEIGITWASLLLHRAVRPVAAASQNLPVVLIGHSFGARLLGRALNSETTVALPSDGITPPPPPRLFIGLQAAFSVNRFLDRRGGEGSPYAKTFAESCAHWVFSASSHDTAVSNAPTSWLDKIAHWDSDRGIYLGDPKTGGYAESTGLLSGRMARAVADKDGKFVGGAIPPKDAKMIFIDSSAFVNERPHQTGGGSHSDVYDRETGQLMWTLFQTYAPNPQL
jgi:hypothetical protein